MYEQEPFCARPEKKTCRSLGEEAFISFLMRLASEPMQTQLFLPYSFGREVLLVVALAVSGTGAYCTQVVFHCPSSSCFLGQHHSSTWVAAAHSSFAQAAPANVRLVESSLHAPQPSRLLAIAAAETVWSSTCPPHSGLLSLSLKYISFPLLHLKSSHLSYTPSPPYRASRSSRMIRNLIGRS